MPDQYPFTLHEIAGARGELHAIADELEVVKLQLTRLPSRAFICSTVLMATASLWAALIGAVVVLLLR